MVFDHDECNSTGKAHNTNSGSAQSPEKPIKKRQVVSFQKHYQLNIANHLLFSRVLPSIAKLDNYWFMTDLGKTWT